MKLQTQTVAAHNSEPRFPGIYHTRTRHWDHGTAGPTIGYPGTAPSAGPTAVPDKPGEPYPAWPHHSWPPPKEEGEPGHQPGYPQVPATGGWAQGGKEHEGEGGRHGGWGSGGKNHGGEGDQYDGIPHPQPHPRPSKPLHPHPKPTGAYPTMPVGTGGPPGLPIGDKPPQYATTLSTVSRSYGKPVYPTAPMMVCISSRLAAVTQTRLTARQDGVQLEAIASCAQEVPAMGNCMEG